MSPYSSLPDKTIVGGDSGDEFNRQRVKRLDHSVMEFQSRYPSIDWVGQLHFENTSA